MASMRWTTLAKVAPIMVTRRTREGRGEALPTDSLMLGGYGIKIETSRMPIPISRSRLRL